MTTENSSLMDSTRTALEQGDLMGARRMLRQIVQTDPQNHRAWLWLAGITESPSASMQYVKRAQNIAPDDPTVHKALQWAEKRLQERQQFDNRVVAAPPPQQQSKTEPKAEEPKANGWLKRFGLGLFLVFGLVGIWSIWQIGPPVVIASEPLVFVATLPPSERYSANKSEQTIATIRTPTHAKSESIWETVQRRTPVQASIPPISHFSENRWIDVNLTTQTLVAYENDVAIYTTLVSSGLYNTPTVTGQFRIYIRYDSQDMSGYHLGYDYYLEDVPFVQYFHKDFALHGAYWHNNFGTPMSHGCVNLSPSDSQWLYNFADIGTLVNVHY